MISVVSALPCVVKAGLFIARYRRFVVTVRFDRYGIPAELSQVTRHQTERTHGHAATAAIRRDENLQARYAAGRAPRLQKSRTFAAKGDDERPDREFIHDANRAPLSRIFPKPARKRCGVVCFARPHDHLAVPQVGPYVWHNAIVAWMHEEKTVSRLLRGRMR